MKQLSSLMVIHLLKVTISARTWNNAEDVLNVRCEERGAEHDALTNAPNGLDLFDFVCA